MQLTPTIAVHLSAALAALALGAGVFTLWPNRYLGQLVWGQWLGWL